MKSLHLKLLLIAVFLLVSIFFLVEIFDLYKSKNYFTNEEISEAVQVIKQKGILIEEDTVIKKKIVPNVIKLDFNSSVSEGIAKRIMQKEYGNFTIPGGFSYTNDSEALSFSDDYSIEYVFLSENITKEIVAQELKNILTVDENGEKTSKKLTKIFFKNINSDPYTVSLSPRKSTTVDGVTYLEAVQCVNDCEIEGAGIIAALKGDKPIFISGKIFFAESYKDYETDYLDSINILFELEESNNEIQSMELIYSSVFDGKKSVYLTPSYKFVYSDGNVKIYDATSASKRN